jgi:hypothetical protein
MADYPPPTQTLPDFNPAVFRTNDTPLTIAEAENYFVSFPTAQGAVNLSSANISGDLTLTNSSTLGTVYGYQSTKPTSVNSIHNTAFGYQAGKGLVNTTGTGGNTAFGAVALVDITGAANNNTAIGHNALEAVTTGDGNTQVGMTTLALAGNLTTASNNTLIGHQASVSGTGISTSTAIGYNAQASASNTIVLGTASETVRFNSLKPLTDASDMTIGAGSTGNITFNISDTNPLRIGTTTPMVNFQSSWYFLGPSISKSLQNMIVTEFYSAGAGLTKTFYRFPINFIPRFFTARMEDTGTFTGTNVSVQFTIYKNNLPTTAILGVSSVITITNTSDILSGTFSSAVSTDGNNDAIYIGLTLDYTTLTALNRNFFICFYGQQTP